MNEQIVITGIGIYSPIGKNANEVYNSLLNSRSGINYINEMDVSNLRNNKGGIIKNIVPIKTRNGLRSNILLKYAVKEAVEDSHIMNHELSKKRIAISVGTSIGGYGGFVDQLYSNYYGTSQKSTLNSNSILTNDSVIKNIPPVLLGYAIAKEYNLSGPVSASITACSASANAISMARDLILSDHADAVIVAGVDPITQLTYIGFNALMALTKGELKTMDEKRSGLLIGEGAGCLILEKESAAIKRNAKIYATLSGCGISNDAFHCTQPHPNAEGAVLAIRRAIEDAQLTPADIDYINLHGTGTRHNDIMELKALKTVFGDKGNIPVSSSKSMMGHTLGAAAAIEAVICLISLSRKILPPNLNVDEKIKGFNYDLIQKTRLNVEVKHILSNSFGFGGNCAALIFSKYIHY